MGCLALAVGDSPFESVLWVDNRNPGVSSIGIGGGLFFAVVIHGLQFYQLVSGGLGWQLGTCCEAWREPQVPRSRDWGWWRSW